MRYIGQRGLQAAIKSKALQIANFHSQLDIILLPIMLTLSNSKNAVDALARRQVSFWLLNNKKINEE